MNVPRIRWLWIALAALPMVVACNKDTGPATVSEAPAEITGNSVARASTSTSDIGIRARISFEDLTTLVTNEMPDTHSGTGRKRECKRVLGIKLCGTGVWTYTVARQAPPTITGIDDKAIIQIPLEFNGTAGMQGDVAKALKLSKLDFNGAMNATVRLGFNLNPDWCPVFSTEVEYEWLKNPKVAWAAGLEFDIRDQLDKAIREQLESLSETLNSKVDCEAFRANLSEHWRSYSFPLNITENETAFLNLEPTGFAFSGLRTEPDRFGVTFVLSSNTTVETAMGELISNELPPLKRVDYTPGVTTFNVLLRLDYDQLQRIAAPTLVGRTFNADTAAGEVSVTINALDISGTTNAIVLKFDFTANLPAHRKDTVGTLYLTSTPVADPVAQEVILIDTKLSKVLDSALWSVLSSVFEGQIIAAIEENAVIDLSGQISDLKEKLQQQIKDPNNTSGVHLTISDLTLDLLNLTPEQQSLAAEVQVAANIDMDFPLQAIKTLRKK